MSVELLPILALISLLAGVGLLMVVLAAHQQSLDLRRNGCPVCGRTREGGCRCWR
jgi:hypothetical protein